MGKINKRKRKNLEGKQVEQPLKTSSILAPFILLLIIAAPLGIAAYKRNSVWKDGISLWEDVVEKAWGKAIGHENLGVAYREDGSIELAIKQYIKALELLPDYPQAYIDLGVAYSDKNLLDDAKKTFYKALEIWPDSAKAHNNFGIVYKAQGLIDEAIREYQKAIELLPDYPDAHNNLGVAYVEKGLLKEGIAEYRKAIALKPVVEIHFNLAIALEQTGEKQAAIKHYEEFIKSAPTKYNLHIEEAKQRIVKLQRMP